MFYNSLKMIDLELIIINLQFIKINNYDNKYEDNETIFKELNKFKSEIISEYK